MSTVIQRQADSAEESVYGDVTTSDHSLRKQTEVQVCCSEWQCCLEDAHIQHTDQKGWLPLHLLSVWSHVEPCCHTYMIRDPPPLFLL